MSQSKMNVINLDNAIIECLKSASEQNVSVPELVSALLLRAASLVIAAKMDVVPPARRDMYISVASIAFDKAIQVEIGKGIGEA